MVENKTVVEQGLRRLLDEQQCTRLYEDGGRCRNRRWAGKKLCFQHDPEAAALRKHKSKGAAEHNKDESEDELELEGLLTPKAIHQLLSRTLTAVEEGKMRVSRAYAVGYLASMLLATLKELNKEASGDADWGEVFRQLAGLDGEE
jgi:hypothetical protein